jgi:hypothetical protein
LIQKSHFYLALIVGSLFGLPAGAVMTSKNVDIIVTHGAPLTTFTFVNNTGATLPAGTPVSMGQAFRYGDIMPGNYPVIRDATTHIALPGQQWDEISTWRESGGNGSWRHAVWAIQLPNSLAAGATYRVEFVPQTGTYSQSSHQSLSTLCSGVSARGAHDLKIHLTDVRNQNDTVRDSGDMTFRVCDNIANTGRDAPRHLRAGNVYDEYEVSGIPVYTSGHEDPLIYAQCIIDLFTKASDGVSLGDTRWVCHVHNSWMNVAAGTMGNPGNPGPAGFTNDPQAVSYRPEIDDGASDVLDWSGLDATVSSASNPIQVASGNGCDTTAGTYCMVVPSSTGNNAWYYGQAMRASCTGTCVAGVNNGQLYYVWPSSSAVSSGTNTTKVALQLSPWAFDSGTFFMTGVQGTGTTAFSTRFQHYHWNAWQTLDASGQDNWSPAGTTTRVTRAIYPALTLSERTYWEETGLVIPINLAQPTPTVRPSWGLGLGLNYEPFGRLNVIGTTGTGERPDLGIVSEWAAQAFVTQAPQDWDTARLFTLGTSIQGSSTLLNETTGRIPVLNNGPPSGPGGNGVGGTYPGLCAPQNQLYWGSSPPVGIADVVHNQPLPQYDISGGTFHGGTYISHMPSFDGFTYAMFGDRHFLDLMQWHGNRDFLQQRVGPGPDLGQGYYRDNNASLGGNTYHYWGLLIDCCQTRGSAWMIRDITYPATFGGDSNIERSYFADFLTENSNYYPLWLAYKDGSGNTNYSSSILAPDNPGSGLIPDTYIISYVAAAAYIMEAFQHAPLGSMWNSKLQRLYEGVLGAQLPGAPVGYYAIDFTLNHATHNGDASIVGFGGNQGQYFNGTDASDFGAFAANATIGTGGQVTNDRYDMSVGGTIKNMNEWLSMGPIDQLSGLNWYNVIGPYGPGGASFYIMCPPGHPVDATCPTPGAAFADFTRGGVSIAGETGEQWKYRPLSDPGPGAGFVNNNYTKYGGATINGLNVLGYSVTNAMSAFNTRAGANYYNSNLPSWQWDPTILVPGLPVAHNGL